MTRGTSGIVAQDPHAMVSAIVNDAPVAIVTVDREYRITSWNPAAERIFGWAAAEVIGAPPPLIPDDLRDEYERRIKATVLDGQPVMMVETHRLRKDGLRMEVQLSVAPLRDAAGTVTGAVAFLIDLSERRATERALRDQEEQYRLLADGLPLLVSYLDAEERYRFVNQAYQRALGVSPDAVIGRSLREVHGEAAYEQIHPFVVDALAGRPMVFEHTHVDGRGGTRHLSISYIPHFNNVGETQGFYALITDATERKRLEEQFRQAQRMEAVGQLAGGVAHDFNNLLTIINTNCELALASPALGADARHEVEEIRRAGARAAALTRQLLAFSRRQVLRPEELDLGAIITDLESMLRRVIGEDITLVTDIGTGLGAVRADRGQLEQVLMNLVVNARDAMPTGGELSISAASVQVDATTARRHVGLAPGAYVMLTVSDTGVGMDAATQQRIFEPFFTTKGVGKGTGLGLSTVYGVVKQSDGHIFVQSAPQRGTTFTVYFPRIGHAPVLNAATPPCTALPRGSETILLVEDEEAVRRVVQRVLTSQGYSVLEAHDGAAALALATTHEAPIHLVLTDVVMPNMSGREFAERLSRIRPAVRVLFMSGYNGTEAASRGVRRSDTAFIEKPFTIEVLARRVRHLLDARGDSESAA
jgi:PAS domain S-box-containing protein